MLHCSGFFNLYQHYTVAAFFYPAALTTPMRVALYGLSYLASQLLATPPPPCLRSVLSRSASQGGFAPLRYKQAQHCVGSVALFPSRPYSIFCIE